VAEDNPRAAKAVKVGESAPAFRLTADDGRQVSLAEYLKKGKVMLVFSRGDW